MPGENPMGTVDPNAGMAPALGGEGDAAMGGNAPNPEPDRAPETVMDDGRSPRPSRPSFWRTPRWAA